MIVLTSAHDKIRGMSEEESGTSKTATHASLPTLIYLKYIWQTQVTQNKQVTQDKK